MADRLALVFPGQGSQAVGMGREWAEAHEVSRRTFEEADEALGFSLARLCWEGPEEELQLTSNTQPAILTVSVAAWRAADEAGLRPALLAGHSLGEYSAQVASGSLEFSDALRLVRRRGELMQEAVPVGEGAMAAVLGLAPEAVESVAAEAAEDQVCTVANYNSPVQSVIAGDAAAVGRAVVLAKEAGARRAVPLKVSAPFHCPLMAPARRGLEPMLAETEFSDPRVPVVSNVYARPLTTGAAARDALARQVDSPVRWVESIQYMAGEGGINQFLEGPPGAVLTGLIRRIAKGSRAVSLGSPESLEEWLRGAGAGG